MAYVEPAGIRVQGNIKIIYTPTGSLSAPSLALLNGVTALDVSGYLFNWNPTANANRGNPRRRLGSTKQYETFGTTTEAIADLEYMVDPQADAGDEGLAAYEEFVEGTTGYLWERLGVPATTALAVDQWVIGRPVLFGPQNIQGDPNDEFADFQVVQPVSLRAPGVGDRVQIVA